MFNIVAVKFSAVNVFCDELGAFVVVHENQFTEACQKLITLFRSFQHFCLETFFLANLATFFTPFNSISRLVVRLSKQPLRAIVCIRMHTFTHTFVTKFTALVTSRLSTFDQRDENITLTIRMLAQSIKLAPARRLVENLVASLPNLDDKMLFDFFLRLPAVGI